MGKPFSETRDNGKNGFPHILSLSLSLSVRSHTHADTHVLVLSLFPSPSLITDSLSLFPSSLPQFSLSHTLFSEEEVDGEIHSVTISKENSQKGKVSSLPPSLSFTVDSLTPSPSIPLSPPSPSPSLSLSPPLSLLQLSCSVGGIRREYFVFYSQNDEKVSKYHSKRERVVEGD